MTRKKVPERTMLAKYKKIDIPIVEIYNWIPILRLVAGDPPWRVRSLEPILNETAEKEVQDTSCRGSGGVPQI
jgi:hypothetical protein